VSLAPTVAPTVGATAQPTADTASTSAGPTPITLTSNGLAIFTSLGCLLGVIGLLALVIAWITLVSDGWGPMLKALIVGNRRGRLRFARRPTNSRARLTGPPGRATPAPPEPLPRHAARAKDRQRLKPLARDAAKPRASGTWLKSRMER
jgi:hypothetical protein